MNVADAVHTGQARSSELVSLLALGHPEWKPRPPRCALNLSKGVLHPSGVKSTSHSLARMRRTPIPS